MLYSAATTDARPAAIGKWVKIPHGGATVSGESALAARTAQSFVPSLGRPHDRRGRSRPGKTRASGVDPQVRIPGHRAVTSSRAHARDRRVPRRWRSRCPSVRSACSCLSFCSVRSVRRWPTRSEGASSIRNGQPVAGARVLVLRGQAVVARATTADDGTFGPLTLAPGRYDVTVAAPGLIAPPKSIAVTADSAADSTSRSRSRRAANRSSCPPRRSTLRCRASSDSVTVIEPRRSRDASDRDRRPTACGSVPGFGVVQSGGRGAVTSLFPRGGESDYTLVLVDGIPQNAFGGGFDAAHLGTADIERIEVVRGPQSALYGGGAIGGIVQVDHAQGGPTRRRRPPAGRRLRHVATPRRRRRDRAAHGAGADRSTGCRPTATRGSATRSATTVSQRRLRARRRIGQRRLVERRRHARPRSTARGGRNERGIARARTARIRCTATAASTRSRAARTHSAKSADRRPSVRRRRCDRHAT